MIQKARYFRIGLFVLAATGAAIAGVIALGAGTLFRDKIRFETYFDESVHGLDVGAPVKFRGVRIGAVEKIVFVSALYPTKEDRHSREVAVVVALSPGILRGRSMAEFEEDIGHRIREGMRVRLASAGLTGGMYLEADYVDPVRFPLVQPIWTPQYTYFPSTPSTGTRVMETIQAVLTQIQGMRIEELSSEIRGAIADLRAAIKNDITPTLQQIGKASAEVPETLVEVRKLAGEIDAFVRKFTTIIEKDIAPAAAQANRTFKRADQLVTSQQDAIDQILDNLRVASSDLKELTGTAKKYPATVLFGEPPPKKEKP